MKIPKWILIIALLIIIIFFIKYNFFFSIFQDNSAYTAGVKISDCNYKTYQCLNIKSGENTRLPQEWIIVGESEDEWFDITTLPVKEFFYKDWNLEEAKQYEVCTGGTYQAYKGITPFIADKLKANANQENIRKYGEMDYTGAHGLFHPVQEDDGVKLGCGTYIGKNEWYTKQKLPENWGLDLFSDKLCWMNLETNEGLITIYGKTKLIQFKLHCILNESHCYLNKKLSDCDSVYRNITKSNTYLADAYSINLDFKQTEFPETTPPQPSPPSNETQPSPPQSNEIQNEIEYHGKEEPTLSENFLTKEVFKLGSFSVKIWMLLVLILFIVFFLIR